MKNRTYLRDYDFARRGRILKLSQREIQRRIGIDRRTIKRIYNKENARMRHWAEILGILKLKLICEKEQLWIEEIENE